MIRRSKQSLGLVAALAVFVMLGCQCATDDAQTGAGDTAQVAPAGDTAGAGDAPAEEPQGRRVPLPEGTPGPLRVIADIDPITPPVTVAATFSDNAFPPLLPKDDNHADAWSRMDCMSCHEDGTKDAPLVEHRGMPPILVEGRCRSCHLPGDKVPEKKPDR